MTLQQGTSLNIGVASISRLSGRGNTNASYHNIFKGKNWLGGKPALEQPKDRTGLIFIARTDLCLTRRNLSGHRYFEPLISQEPLSVGRAIAATLDPRSSRQGKPSRLVDPLYGFNALLDNTTISCTGWPDNVINVSSTAPNSKGASTQLAEGDYQNGKPFDLTFEHLNTEGDIITQMYGVLTRYPLLVRKNSLAMYLDNVLLDRADYKSRVYRFVLDVTGTRVIQFTMTGEAFPVTDSTGAAMNYTTDSSVNEGYETVSAQWKCGGFFHNDPIVIDEFNRTQIAHNPGMADSEREKIYYRVGSDEGLPSLAVANLYQYMGYPRINPITLEFEIWVLSSIHTLLKGYSDIDEFKSAMIAKNDADLYGGSASYNQDAFKKLMGWGIDTLPAAGKEPN